MPADGSKNPLRVVVVSVKSHKSLAVVDATSFVTHAIRTGDIGYCLFFPIFQSKHHTDLYLVQFSSQSVVLGNGVESHDGSELLTDDQYLQTPDVKTVLLIFQSLQY